MMDCFPRALLLKLKPSKMTEYSIQRIPLNMEIWICPRCNNAIYINTKKLFPLCFKCGCVLVERRMFDRKEKVANIFFFGVVPQKALTKDVSDTGARIAYSGKPFEQDTVLNFKFEGSTARKSGKVVWSRKMGSKRAESGLRYVPKRIK